MYRTRAILLGTAAPSVLLGVLGASAAVLPEVPWIVSMALVAMGVVAWLFVPWFHPWLRAQPRACVARPVVVGGGWSFFLAKTRAEGFRRVAAGHIEGDWWHAGTTIREVQRRLISVGRTMASHPSVMSGTLGGWIFSNAHGSGGTLWTPQFDSVRVHDRETGESFVVSPKRLFSAAVPLATQRRYDILAVKVRSVENVVCQ